MIRRTPRQLILALAATALLCALAGVVAAALRPPHYTSRPQAIGAVLDQHRIAYERVYLERGWPDQINTSAFTSGIVVVVPGGAELRGRYECRDGERNCWMAVPRLGLDMQPVPDLSRPADIPLLDWIDAQIAAIRAGQHTIP